MKTPPTPTPHSPSDLGVALRLACGTAIIFLSFGAMNMLSRHAMNEANPAPATGSASAEDFDDDTDEFEIFDEALDIQPDQPADSPGALPAEDPETNNA
jgi:hypothetical protein